MDTLPLVAPQSGVVAFDYAAMAADVADEARAVVARVRERQRAYVIDTGRDLLAVKARLEHGLFIRWVEAEMSMTARTAQNAMRAASELGHKSETVSHLPPTTLYQLTAPSTPALVRKEIVERIEAGEALSPRHIGGLVHQAQARAREEQKAAKLTPEERQRQAKSKRDAEARRKREHEKWRRENEERCAQRKAAAVELAGILAPLLSDGDFKRVYALIHDVNTFDMRAALTEARNGSAFDTPNG